MISVLDDETLKEVGRFAIEIRTLDEVITSVAGASLECAEWDIALFLNERLTNGSKLDRIANVCAKLAKAYGLVDATFYKALVDQIGFVRKIIQERNVVIHGEVIVKRGERPTVRSKNQPVVDLSPSALSLWVQEIDRASLGLITAHTDFMDAVYKARAAQKTPAHTTT